ncbi:MAG: dihydroorotase [Phycisphaerales bacterium]|jgi:dihydroorotase
MSHPYEELGPAHSDGTWGAYGTPILIRGGRVINPSTKFDKVCDVLMHAWGIEAISKRIAAEPGMLVIDAEGLIVAPGLVDPHVHLRQPGGEHKETLYTGARAALAGGFTTVCCMPNTTPALDSPELVRYVMDAAPYINIFPVAAATKGRKGEELAEIELLAKAGAVGFSDDGDCIASAGIMARVLTAVARTGLAFMQHCQEPTLTRGASMHAGAISLRLGLGGWPRVAEELIIERDIRLNRNIGCRYHVQHISSADSVELVKRARRDGQPVTAEASPHHLHLTHEACDGYNTLAKVNPPLREKADVQALRQGVADGTITILATDHAPHSVDEKQLPFEDAPFGLVGLETAVPLYAEALVHTGAISWPRLIALLTTEPAKLCGLDTEMSWQSDGAVGVLVEDGRADVTLIDPDRKWTIDESCLAGKSKNTPFLGTKVRGRVVGTFVQGELRYEHGLKDRVRRAEALTAAGGGKAPQAQPTPRPARRAKARS